MPLIQQLYKPINISKKIIFLRFLSKVIINFFFLDKIKIFSNVFQQKLTTFQTIKIKEFYLKFLDGNERLNIFYQTQFFIEKDLTKWILKMSKKDIFYDIGSNVGMFSCLSGKKKIKTFSFECMNANLHNQTYNIKLNKVEKYVSLIPIMLSNKNSLEFLQHRDLTAGAAKNEVKNKKNIYNRDLKSVLDLKIPSFKLDAIIKSLELPYPTKVKIDVDGAELLILMGMTGALKKTNEIMIELDGREQYVDKCLAESQKKKESNFESNNEIYHAKKSFKHRDYKKILFFLKKYKFKIKSKHGNNYLFKKS